MSHEKRVLVAPELVARLDPQLIDFIVAMPKAEIHVHLEGAIRPPIALELAQRHDDTSTLPASTADGLRQWFRFVDFPHFIQIYLAISSLLRTPDDFELITYACGADMAAQNIRYRELTFTPYTHTDLQTKGLTNEEIMAGLTAGRLRAKDDFGVEMRWIFDVPRNASFPPGYASHNGEGYDPRPAERTLAYALAGRANGVVGFGLGGYEVGAPPEPFAHAFAAAQEGGLLSVPHAGETMGAASVAGALHALNADRIGHGVRAMEDPALLLELRDRQIPLEINPTSNTLLHVYRQPAEHPFAHLDRMGIFVTVNSDDPPLFNTTLVQEYATLAAEFGYGPADLARIARNAFMASGVEAPVKAALLADFDQWAASAL